MIYNVLYLGTKRMSQIENDFFHVSQFGMSPLSEMGFLKDLSSGEGWILVGNGFSPVSLLKKFKAKNVRVFVDYDYEGCCMMTHLKKYQNRLRDLWKFDFNVISVTPVSGSMVEKRPSNRFYFNLHALRASATSLKDLSVEVAEGKSLNVFQGYSSIEKLEVRVKDAHVLKDFIFLFFVSDCLIKECKILVDSGLMPDEALIRNVEFLLDLMKPSIGTWSFY